MKKEPMTDEAKTFIQTLRFMNSQDGKEKSILMDEETVKLYTIWYNTISKECGKIYSKSKVREIKKQLLEEAKKHIIRLESSKIIGYDKSLDIINKAEETKIKELEEGINYINNIKEDELINLIIDSLFVSEEYMNILLEHKREMEQSKLSQLSYNGEKCVDGSTINTELLKKIYEEIKRKELNAISQKVEISQSTNRQFINLNKIKYNSKNIITYHVAKIYKEKIEKIESEIKEELENLSKTKYKKYMDSEYINLFRIREQLKEDIDDTKTGLSIFKRNKQKKLVDLKKTVVGTIEHKQKLEKYSKILADFEMTKEIEDVYKTTKTWKKINDRKEDILSRSGIIIDNLTSDIMNLYADQLKKEVDETAKSINNEIKELCSQDEESKITDFANTIGMSVEQAINFLRNEDSIYACLYTYIFGTEVLSKLDNNNAELILDKLDPRWKNTDSRISSLTQDVYKTQRENTKSLQYIKYPQKKIPPK